MDTYRAKVDNIVAERGGSDRFAQIGGGRRHHAHGVENGGMLLFMPTLRLHAHSAERDPVDHWHIGRWWRSADVVLPSMRRGVQAEDI